MVYRNYFPKYRICSIYIRLVGSACIHANLYGEEEVLLLCCGMENYFYTVITKPVSECFVFVRR